MIRKPVMAITGLFWVGVALSGCESCGSCWGRKEVGYGSPPSAQGFAGTAPQPVGWNQQPGLATNNAPVGIPDASGRYYAPAYQPQAPYAGASAMRPAGMGALPQNPNSMNNAQLPANSFPASSGGFDRTTAPANSWPMDDASRRGLMPASSNMAPIPPSAPGVPNSPATWNTAPPSPMNGAPMPGIPSAPAGSSMAPAPLPPPSTRMNWPATGQGAPMEPPPVPMATPGNTSQTRYLDVAPQGNGAPLPPQPPRGNY